MKTNQEAFDHVWTALNKQGKPCANTSGCHYRKDGDRCAAGHLIKSDCEDMVQNQDAIVTSLIKHLGGNNPFDCSDIEFLRELQVAHDHCVSRIESVKHSVWLDAWRFRMRELALRFGLTVPGE